MRSKLVVVSSLAAVLAFVACSTFEEVAPPTTTPPGPDSGADDGATPEGAASLNGITFTFLDSADPAYVMPGADLELAFVIARQPGSAGPINVSVTSALPAGLSVVPLIVPAGENQGRVLIRAASATAQGLVAVDVAAVEDVPNGARAGAKRNVFVRGKPGTLDETFGDKGLIASIWPAPFTGNLEDATTTADGSLLVTGYRANPNSVHALAKLTKAGTKDATFEGGGIVTVQGSQVGTAVVVHPETFALKGTIDVMSGGLASIAIHRYDATGKPVTAFNNGEVVATISGFSQAAGQQLAPLADGKVLLLGSYSVPASFAVSRWTAAGAVDATYGSGGACPIDGAGTGGANNNAGGVGRMMVSADGSVRVAFAIPGGNAWLKRCTPGGVIDPALSKSLGAGYLVEVASTPDGGMVVLSSIVGDGTLQWRRFSAVGILDTTIGTAGTVATPFMAQSAGLVVQPDGKVLIGIGDQADFVITRYLPTGFVDTTFGTQGKLSVPVAGTNVADLRKLVRQPDGRIVALGLQYNTANGAIVRFWP